MTVAAFWAFARERQAIWQRRAAGAAPPWTADPVLRKYWFTNVHRELDTGTIVLRRAVSDRADLSLEDRVFGTLVYRGAFNTHRMWTALDLGCVTPATWPAARERIAAYWVTGQPIFTRAWVLPPLTHLPGATRLDRVAAGIARWDALQLAAQLGRARSLAAAYAVLQGQVLLGEFTAWQCALDMTYLFAGFTDDERPPYLHNSAGKLAKASYKPRGSGEALRLLGVTIEQLRAEQPADWAAVAWSAKPRLTYADLEHTLCEWLKYEQLKNASTAHRGRLYA